jgi:hypothetical protein
MKIDIEHVLVKTPTKITIDGKVYPITGWNNKVVGEYWHTGDEKVLEDLKDWSLEI